MKDVDADADERSLKPGPPPNRITAMPAIPKITAAQLRLLRWHAEGRIDYPPRGKREPLQRAGYMTPGWPSDLTPAGLALLASTPEPRAAQLDREIATTLTKARKPSIRRRR